MRINNNDTKLYLARELPSPKKIDVGIFTNRLLSYDYQKEWTDKIIRDKKDFNLYFAGADKFGREEFMKYLELYFANPEQPQLNNSGMNVLFNFIDGKVNTDFYKEKIKPGKLFIDSGAFSAWTKGKNIECDEYIAWLNDRVDFIDLFGQIDVIPGDRVQGATQEQVNEAAEATWKNYLYMRERVINKDGLLYTFHVNEPIRYLKQALEWTDEKGKHIPYIALGGMVGKPRVIRKSFLDNCFDCIKKSSNPHVKVHAFGMTDFTLLEDYPIYSADSTSWIMIAAMGNIMTDRGSIAVSDKQVNEPNHYSHLPKKDIEKFEHTISQFGFKLKDLSEFRDNRVMFNALYMQDKASKIDNTKSKLHKRKLF